MFAVGKLEPVLDFQDLVGRLKSSDALVWQPTLVFQSTGEDNSAFPPCVRVVLALVGLCSTRLSSIR